MNVPEIRINITGIKETISNLAKFERFPQFLEDATLKMILFVQSKVPPYPPPPPQSTYTRTGDLGRKITTLQGKEPDALSRIETIGGGVRGIIGTKLEYAPFVIDEDEQAKVHQGRWYTLQGVVRGLVDDIKAFYQKQIDRWIGDNF